MKISEKQISKLMIIIPQMHNIALYSHPELLAEHKYGGLINSARALMDIISEISHQQSEELKEVE